MSVIPAFALYMIYLILSNENKVSISFKQFYISNRNCQLIYITMDLNHIFVNKSIYNELRFKMLFYFELMFCEHL